MFEIPAVLLSWFYGLTSSYIAAIAMIAAVVMAVTTPLTLKSTKGMLEMQRLAPEMRKLQNEHRNDKAKLNEEMMKLYQEHKVNPMASCLPLVAQMPVFIIMFRVLHGLTYKPHGATQPVAATVWKAFGNEAQAADPGFIPRYLPYKSALYQALFSQHTMTSLGIDLSKSAAVAITEGFSHSIVYVLLVVLLGVLYFVQQRMVAARAGDQPDDVAEPAEADAVPAGLLRRVPGVLPGRPRRVLHLSDGAAHRPADVHHEGVLRP